jgi:hypothetical protein
MTPSKASQSIKDETSVQQRYGSKETVLQHTPVDLYEGCPSVPTRCPSMDTTPPSLHRGDRPLVGRHQGSEAARGKEASRSSGEVESLHRTLLRHPPLFPTQLPELDQDV